MCAKRLSANHQRWSTKKSGRSIVGDEGKCVPRDFLLITRDGRLKSVVKVA